MNFFGDQSLKTEIENLKATNDLSQSVTQAFNVRLSRLTNPRKISCSVSSTEKKADQIASATMRGEVFGS